MQNILIAYVIWNAIVFFIYGIDKALAKAQSRRISEKFLLTLAVLLGGVGAWAGMRIFRHKTRHAKFVYAVPILAFLNLAVLFFVFRGMDI